MQFTSCIFSQQELNVGNRKLDTRTGIRSHLSGVFQQPASELDIGGEIKRRQQLPLTIATSRSGYSYNGHKQKWIFLQWQGVDILSVATMAAQVNEHNINHVCPFLVIIVRAD